MTNQEFIDQIAVYIKKYAAIFGICVHSPIIAQAILESGWGKSKLAATYHNYFGLKCGTKWTGKSVNMNTQEEYEPGVLTTIADNFRVFDSMEEGVKGYFEFIQLSRYQNLKGITDPKTYLETIKADGYATSSAYVQNNMDLVEQYELTKYDNEKGDNMSDRQKPGNWLAQYKGIAEGSEQHKAILKVFNDSGLCTRYKMTVNDAWCATSVSAAFIASGLSNIFPCVECSCENMINLAISAGIWVENDAYVPDVGDVILYDWDDNGVGDCTGWSEPGQVARFKSITDDSETKPTSRFVEDYNLLTFSSLNVYYDFRECRFMEKSFLQRMKATFYMNDIATISSVKTERGTSYPFARSFSFSLQVTF